MEIPDSLAQRIELFRESAQAYQATDEMFRVDRWMQVMLGQRLRPRGYHHMGRMLGPERLRKALETLQGQHRRRGVKHAHAPRIRALVMRSPEREVHR